MNSLDTTFAKLDDIIKSGDMSFDYGFDLVNKNYSTGKQYLGVFNNMILSINRARHNYRFPYWIGFNQALKSFIPVKKGEKGVPIMIKQYDIVSYDDNGNEVENESENATKSVKKHFWNSAFVFNIEQTSCELDSINAFEYSENYDDAKIILDKYLDREKIAINQSTGFCSYSPINDTIQMKDFSYFYDKLAYYESLCHECAHSTGHSTRLNRLLLSSKRSEDYANEEIIAEFAVMMMFSELGLERRNKDFAYYINSWIKQTSMKDIYELCKHSQKALDFIKRGRYEEQ